MKGDTISRNAILNNSMLHMMKKKDVLDLIRNAPTVEPPVVHGRWVPSKKHKWILNENGEIDFFAYSEDIHNGPECEICGESFCEHCEKDWATTECREPHYECSVCGAIEKRNSHAYCHCGARMDAEEGAGE